LTPAPQPSDFFVPWKEVQQNKFTLSTNAEDANIFFSKIVKFDLKHMRLEWALLAVESLNKSFMVLKEAKAKPDAKAKKLSKVLKLMFKKYEGVGEVAGKDKHKGRPSVVIYEHFRNHALRIVERRCSQKKACAGTTAMYLLISIVRLIYNCEFVKNPEHLITMKSHGIDWEEGIEEVRTVTAAI
jgi:hypothetical protein